MPAAMQANNDQLSGEEVKILEDAQHLLTVAESEARDGYRPNDRVPVRLFNIEYTNKLSRKLIELAPDKGFTSVIIPPSANGVMAFHVAQPANA